MRVAFSAPPAVTAESFGRGFRPVATAYDFDWQLHDRAIKPRVLILVSKIGHCLNDLLYRHSIGHLGMELVAVVSNHEAMRRRVEADGLPYIHLPVTPETRDEQEAGLVQPRSKRSGSISSCSPATCRFSRTGSRPACRGGRSTSTIPSCRASSVRRPYHKAHERGVKLIGATAHYVTPDLDEGPIIEQDVGRVDHAMSVEEMIALGRDIEATVLARAVRFHLEHRVLINGVRTVVFR